MRATGRARVNPSSPRAFAICDRCGFMYNRSDLSDQVDYRGSRLVKTGLSVCDNCLDTPQPQMKQRVLTIDPPTVPNALPETEVTARTSVTTTYTILTTDQLVACSGTFTVTLPTAVTTDGSDTPPVTLGTHGRTFTVQNNGTGVITIATTGGQTIEGASTYTLAAGSEIAVYSNGANWRTI